MANSIYNNKKSNHFVKAGCDRRSAKSEVEQILEASNDAIRIINSDFTIRRINHVFSSMIKLNQNRIAGKKCWEVFPCSSCHTPKCPLQRIIDGEKNIQAETEYKKRDGSAIYCLVTTFPLIDESNEICGMIEQFRDITEHRQMEKQIKESESRYRALIELGTEVGEAIVMLQDIDGVEGAQTFISDQWPIITGYDKNELLGTSIFDLIHPDDKLACIGRHRQKMAGKTAPGLYEMKIIKKDGGQTVVELTGANTLYQDKTANVVYIRDVTERKKLETALEDERDKYRSLFDDAPIALWESDYSGIKIFLDELRQQGIVDFHKHFTDNPADLEKTMKLSRQIRYNRAHLDLFEYNIIDEQTHKKERDIVSNYPENYLAFKDDYARLAEGEITFSKEEPIRTMKNNIRYILTKFTIAPGYEDTWGRVFTSLTDITKRKEAEDELKQYKDNLERLVKERTFELDESRKQLEEEFANRIEFTRALVHELKTPLTPMLGTSEILAHELQEEPYSSYAKNLYQGSCQLDSRVDELLDIAKGEIGILNLNCEELDTVNMLHDIVDFMSVEAKKRSQKVIVDLHPAIRPLWADKERLQQILMNLLANAFKYTQEGGTITLKAYEAENAMIFKVIDSGVGMDEEIKRKLFKPYETAKGKKAHFGGLGLGLSLCRMLVELHSGQISVDSEKGKGTSVRFSIPYTHNKVQKQSVYEWKKL
jgi:PAS domain S-box-containing protein